MVEFETGVPCIPSIALESDRNRFLEPDDMLRDAFVPPPAAADDASPPPPPPPPIVASDADADDAAARSRRPCAAVW